MWPSRIEPHGLGRTAQVPNGPRREEPAPRPASWPVLVGALTLLLSACTSTFNGNFRQTAQTSETGDQKLAGATSQLDASLEGNLGPDAEYRVSDRLIYDYFYMEGAGTDSDQTRFRHNPSVETILRSGPLEWTQLFNVEDTTTRSSDGEDEDRWRSILLQEVQWAPEAWPRMTARLDRRTDENDTFVNREEIYTVLQAEDARGPFSWLYAFETQTITDEETDLARRNLENRYRLQWRDEFQDGDLNTSLLFTGKLQRNTSEFDDPGSGVPPGEVFPVQGLSIVDTTPTFAVLTSTPALIDGDETTPTAINIGGFASGGQNSWNIGVGLSTTELLDTVLLTTDVEVPSFLVDQFTFSVWSSSDNSTWTLVDGSASYTYDAAGRRFRISFTPVADLYLKVVNEISPPSAPALFVTEMRVFAPGVPGGGTSEEVRDTSEHGVRGNVSWRGIEDVTLTWDVFGQIADTETNGVATRGDTTLDNFVTALWAPLEQFDFNLRAQSKSINRDMGGDDTLDAVGGTALYRPLDTLELNAGYDWSTRVREAISDVTSKGSRLSATAELLETLDAQIGYQHLVQDDRIRGVNSDRDIFSAGLIARVTPRLDLTVNWSNELAEQSGPGAIGEPDTTSENYELLVKWLATEYIRTEMQLVWRDATSGTGLDERYRIDWTPLPDGSVDVTVDFLRRVDGLSELGTDQYTVLLQWLITPRARLTFSYGALIPEEDERTNLLTGILDIRF